MPAITWDKVGTRRYENGVDHGVLYPPEAIPVSWSGLTSIVEKTNVDVDSIYFDGVKVGNAITYGEYNAELSCITYPPEFDVLQGMGELREGVFVGDQPLQTFGLCYRTQVGNDLGGDAESYVLHIVYNLVAVPSDKTYASQSDDPSLVEYSYELVSVPEAIPGYRATAQITVKSAEVYPWMLEELEAMLYGTDMTDPVLIPMVDLVVFLRDWARVKITVHADGTWSATSDWSGFISLLGDDTFMLSNVNAYFTDDTETTFVIEDTVEDPNLVQFEVIDNENGTWTARSNQLNVIVDIGDGLFEIRDIEPSFTGPDMFRISTKRLD